MCTNLFFFSFVILHFAHAKLVGIHLKKVFYKYSSYKRSTGSIGTQKKSYQRHIWKGTDISANKKRKQYTKAAALMHTKKKNMCTKVRLRKKNPQRINLGFIKFKRGINVKYTLYFNTNNLTVIVVLISFVANF